MKVFKFGGASVKDAAAVRNVVNVLRTVGHQDCLIVISAMGKTTNALEDVVAAYFNAPQHLKTAFQKVKEDHFVILNELFSDQNKEVYKRVTEWFHEIELFLANNKSPNYNFVYDQIVSYGEIISSTILSAYLAQEQIANEWLDARNLIKTDTVYRDAVVDWKATEEQVIKEVAEGLLYVTQGFIGSDPNHFSATLGREGSDYSAAIFAYCLNAESVTIWKDVPGVLNADPRYFSDTSLLHHISYREAIEMAFYGASVIHPKTLQPLQEKHIPLYVKSFVHPTLPGTEISKGATLQPQMPIFIVKKNQLLLSIAAKDFSFIMEENISTIFKLLGVYRIKVNVIQNSAISFTVCVEDKFDKFRDLITDLGTHFRISYNENVSLYTIRHFNDEALQQVIKGKEILLKQVNRETVQLVAREN